MRVRYYLSGECMCVCVLEEGGRRDREGDEEKNGGVGAEVPEGCTTT